MRALPEAAAQGGGADERLLSPRGLRMMIGVGLGMSFSVGLLLLYSVGVLLPAVAAETGWSRVAITAAAAPALMIVGLMGPVVGFLVDRHGARRILIGAVLLQAVGMAALAVGSQTIWLFALCYALASLLGAGHAHIPYSSAVAATFDEKRGTALGFAFGLGGIGVAIIPALSSYYLGQFGWRWTYMLLGLTALAVSLPIALWAIPAKRPGKVAATGKAAIAGAAGPALRSPLFWILATSFAATAFSASAGAVMLPSILADRGAPSEFIASIMVIVAISLAIGRIASGILLDRFNGIYLAIVLFVFPVFGHLLLWWNGDLWTVALAGFCFGVALGGEGDVMAFLLARLFGIEAFGKLYGLCYLGYAMGSGLGPAGLSWLQSVGHGPTSFLFLAGVSIAGTSLLFAGRNLSAAPQAVAEPA